MALFRSPLGVLRARKTPISAPMGLQMIDLEKGWLKMKSEKPMLAACVQAMFRLQTYSDYTSRVDE